MTENEARAIADGYVVSNGFDVAGFHSSDRIADPDKGSVEWVFRFKLAIPDDVVSSEELLLVTVDDRSGDVSVFDSL